MARNGSVSPGARSPLVVIVAVALTGATLLLFLAVLRLGRSDGVVGPAPPYPGETAAVVVQAAVPPPALPRGPRLVGARGHVAEQRGELAGLDRLARARAAAAVGLGGDEAGKAEEVYRRADARRAEIEAQLDDASSSKPALRSPSRLRVHEGHVLAAMEQALGEARAQALREAEALAYEELVEEARARRGRTFPMDEAVARRRQDALAALHATIQLARSPELAEGQPSE
jgi:hypothetical protein